ncbi:S-receptor-like serine/threonine-protein kinase [Trema orientale]|uniref:Receptor-like serine/threonine-protein kinase n=1 Tax=Trema orientale TaxID=63057 RepID=A0A2P5FDI6_TREOI|nr:S-receptor-like serine/threonine-protein kinase [Trema orientale]
MAYFRLFFILVTFSSYLTSAIARLNSSLHLLPGKEWSLTTRGLSSSVNLVPGETVWTNDIESLPETVHFTDVTMARFILLQEIKLHGDHSGFAFGLCFYCTSSTEESCYLTVMFVDILDGVILKGHHQVVWTANRDRPVGAKAVLKFSHKRNLEIYDAQNNWTWSSKTAGALVSSMRIKENGNLVLLNVSGGRVWQSFHHLTDTLLDGQVLKGGQHLVSRIHSKNMSSGLFSLNIDSLALSAYAKADDKPTRYLFVRPNNSKIDGHRLNFVEFRKANLTFHYQKNQSFSSSSLIFNSSRVQILRLDIDGGLRIHGWNPGKSWRVIHVFTLKGEDECQFPLKCGRYGVCRGEKCKCPVSIDGVRHFKPLDRQHPNYGCHQTHYTPSQGTFDKYRVVNFGNLSYFSYYDVSRAVPGLEYEDSCVDKCERNTSCKAAFFMFDTHASKGYCFLTADVLSLMETPSTVQYYSSLHMKIGIHSDTNVTGPSPSPQSSTSQSYSFGLVLSSIFSCLLALLLVAIVCLLVFQKKKIDDWNDHGLLKQVSSKVAIKSFSYLELYVATKKFSEKLGQGGFGTVFKGVFKDGGVVAVKRLETKQGTKEFLREVETVGAIHHINLVRLIGFCANRKHRMLVYEYMSKGSLDKWIFCGNTGTPLDWNTRKKIVMDIAKGLTYLHEECRYKIAHLDVKPHNILLDDNFNAKLSDFGLSKLIKRDESQVVTGARGTLGYLAPEWEHSRITVKADVYSFGILLLEIITGRKILDFLRPHSSVHLLSLLQKKALENQLKDLVECQSEDMQNHVEEAIDMMRLGMWCSDSDYTRRPSMSTVVKVLEGETHAAGTQQQLDEIAPSQ